MIYPFGRSPGHLPVRALAAAEAIGVTVRNSADADGKPMHWLSFELDGSMGALTIFAKVDHVLRVMGQWRPTTNLAPGVDHASMTCETHGCALVCPSCRMAALGSRGGSTLSEAKLKQLKRAAKRKRPGARKENRNKEVN